MQVKTQCIETYSHREQATEMKLFLREHGIEAQVVVDPLESIAPALSPFRGVGLMVPEASVDAAARLLHQPYKKAG